jgi:metal-dependent amidase/aminoacylase/carboxypeptidase family protein
MPGYLPIKPVGRIETVLEAVRAAYPAYDFEADEYVSRQMTASTDFGDVSVIMPLLQFYTGGYSGIMHHPSLTVTDEYVPMC